MWIGRELFEARADADMFVGANSTDARPLNVVARGIYKLLIPGMACPYCHGVDGKHHDIRCHDRYGQGGGGHNYWAPCPNAEVTAAVHLTDDQITRLDHDTLTRICRSQGIESMTGAVES